TELLAGFRARAPRAAGRRFARLLRRGAREPGAGGGTAERAFRGSLGLAGGLPGGSTLTRARRLLARRLRPGLRPVALPRGRRLLRRRRSIRLGLRHLVLPC